MNRTSATWKRRSSPSSPSTSAFSSSPNGGPAGRTFANRSCARWPWQSGRRNRQPHLLARPVAAHCQADMQLRGDGARASLPLRVYQHPVPHGSERAERREIRHAEVRADLPHARPGAAQGGNSPGGEDHRRGSGQYRSDRVAADALAGPLGRSGRLLDPHVPELLGHQPATRARDGGAAIREPVAAPRAEAALSDGVRPARRAAKHARRNQAPPATAGHSTTRHSLRRCRPGACSKPSTAATSPSSGGTWWT